MLLTQNAMLENITITGATLEPAFDAHTTEYTLNGEARDLAIMAYNPDAEVTVIEENDTIAILVTSPYTDPDHENTAVTYTCMIYRQRNTTLNKRQDGGLTVFWV